MAKFKFSVGTRYVGSTVTETVEVPDKDLEDLVEYERDKVIEEYFNDWMWNEVNGGWSEIVTD